MTSKRGLWIVSLLVLAAFGPYLAGGLRTEQVAVYGALVFIAPAAIGAWKPGMHLGWLMALWGLLALVNVIGGLYPPDDFTSWGRGGLVAGLDNALLPLAVMVVVTSLLALGADRRALVRRVAGLTAVAMCVNTAAAIMQYRGYEWTAWLGSADSTSARAITSGRYSGIINQPAEAGVLYGVAMLCAIYLWGGKPRRLFLALAVLLFGGVMTVSKVFLLGAVPIVVFVLARRSKSRPSRLGTMATLAVAGYVAVASGALPAWTGVDQLRSLIPHGHQDLVSNFTANRYGADSTLSTAIHAGLNGPWLFGFGGAGLNLPYDSGWVEAMLTAGLMGVAIQVAVFVIAWHRWQQMPKSVERTLLGGVLALLFAASFGVPSLTANRVATVVWLLLACLTSSGLNTDLRPRAGRAGGGADVQHPGNHAHLAHHSGVGGGSGQ